jgi:hypothetical protein
MTRYKFLLILFFCKSFSQTPNNLSYEKSFFNGDVVSITENKFRIQYGLPNKITVFSNYSRLQISTGLANFSGDKMKNFHDLNLGITKELDLKNEWDARITFNPQFRTNDFETGDFDNMIYKTGISFRKKFKNESSLDFGAEYGALFGKPSVYPVFKYNGRINEKAVYTIGFPDSNFKYDVNGKSSFLLNAGYSNYSATINGGAYGMINKEVRRYDTFFLSGIKASLEYNYTFFNGCIINIVLGKSFENTLGLKDNNNTVSGYGFKNTGMISMGFKYNLNFK